MHSFPLCTMRASRFLMRFVFVLASVALVCGLSLPYSGKNGFIPQIGTTAQAAESSLKKPTIVINSSTSTITSKTGYDINLTVTNTTDSEVEESTLYIFTSTHYAFTSTSEMQDWSEGNAQIPMSLVLAQTTVPTLAHGQSTDITISVKKNDAALREFMTWGARPVLIQWSTTGKIIDTVHTFVTRANDRSDTKDLPDLKLVVALPVSTANTADCIAQDAAAQEAKDLANSLISPEESSQTAADNSMTSNKTQKQSSVGTRCATNMLSEVKKLQDDYSHIHIIPDSSLLSAAQKELGRAATTHIQPYGIDIATIANAGQTHRAHNLTSSAQSALNDTTSANSDSDAIAWQGITGWTSQALQSAASQGYNTIVATSDYTTQSDDAIHNSILHTKVNGANITILTAQSELSSLVQGNATSYQSDAENSDAGKINRLIAQSALFEAQAPYEDRTVLIAACDLTSSLSSQRIAYLRKTMDALQQAQWVSFASIHELEKSEPVYTEQETEQFISQVPEISEDEHSRINSLVAALNSSHTQLTTFENEFLDAESTDQSNQQNGKDPQALAKGDVNKAKDLDNFDERAWMKQFYVIASSYAAQSLSPLAINSYVHKSSSHQLTAHESITKTLYSALKISVPSSLHIVNQSASVPVTVTNDLPVPVKIRVNAQSTGKVSSEVRVGSSENIRIAAHNRTQVMLPVTAISGWTVTFKIFLTDTHGTALSDSTQRIEITSNISILDNAGYGIFALALLLAVVGARRQMHRQKEPLASDTPPASSVPSTPSASSTSPAPSPSPAPPVSSAPPVPPKSSSSSAT